MSEDLKLPDGQKEIQLKLKRKKRTALFKSMMKDAGYGDLAKMISIKEK